MLEQLCIIKEPAKMLEGDEAPCHDVCDTIEHKETLNYVSDISAKAVQNLCITLRTLLFLLFSKLLINIVNMLTQLLFLQITIF